MTSKSGMSVDEILSKLGRLIPPEPTSVFTVQTQRERNLANSLAKGAGVRVTTLKANGGGFEVHALAPIKKKGAK